MGMRLLVLLFAWLIPMDFDVYEEFKRELQ